jgi:hypothetical protein
MRKTMLIAVAILFFAAAASFTPVALADSSSDTYSATFTCTDACTTGAAAPTAPNGAYFADPATAVSMTYGGITDDIFIEVIAEPTDAFTWSAVFSPTSSGQLEFFTIFDKTDGDSAGVESVVPTGVTGFGALTLTDVSTQTQPAPEPSSLPLLAMGLVAVAFVTTRRSSRTDVTGAR